MDHQRQLDDLARRRDEFASGQSAAIAAAQDRVRAAALARFPHQPAAFFYETPLVGSCLSGRM